MVSIPQIATYISYLFVIVAYTIKVVKVARMPKPLRWELYPVPHEIGHKYGGSYYEELEWWTKPRRISRLRDVLIKMKHYFTFPSYFSRNKGYWLGLFPWHIGFYTIVAFHVLSAFSALLMVGVGMKVAAISPDVFGVILYYATIVLAVCSFILGSIGSVILLGERLFRKDLRTYATASNFFNYVFFLTVFVSGLVAWLFFDPTLAGYREYWVSVLTFTYYIPEAAEYIHIMLFSLFLVYLPFTRSTHYITNLIAYFGILWEDTPNINRNIPSGQIKEALGRPVSWSAAHIQKGKTWGELAAGMPEDPKGTVK
jgi:nitrate reductase gamma subunit